MADSWSSFAAREPYFAVLTQDRFLRANLDHRAKADFYESGESHVSEVYEVIGAHIDQHFVTTTLLEYGCGPGRLLIPFARKASSVTGVDIAPAMLEIAREAAAEAGVPGIELLTAGEFDRDQRQFDLVNCHLLLQRLRPAAGLRLLEQLVERVRLGGIGVFQFPYRARGKRIVAVARALRARVPGVNAVLNIARGKSVSMPFIESNIYDMNEVFALLRDSGFDSPYVVFATHGELDTVTVFAQRRAHRRALIIGTAEPETEMHAPADPSFIDVKKLIRDSSIEELNRTAEEYFSSLTDWEDHLAKPFARADDAPVLLIHVAVMLQGLALTRGMTVLEYGAGTGWLSRFLTQLGCEAILLDVSPTALKIARELYARQPVIGERPAPRFLLFDGRKIDLPDESVERIVCFDAFHHATDPDAMLAEFARVLKPAGIAGFAEPGPHHSRTPQSQYEMRTYGVVENDIDIRAIWESAQRHGFADLRLAALNATRFHVSLREYEDLLAAGATYSRWADHTRAFMKNIRDFFLIKAGTMELDSRRTEGLRASIAAQVVDARTIRVTVRNTGTARWLPSTETYGGVAVGGHLYDSSGRLLQLDLPKAHLPGSLAAGEEAVVGFMLPKLEPGAYDIEIDLVANQVAWFAQIGSRPARVPITVTS